MCGIFLIISKKKFMNLVNNLKKRGLDAYKFKFLNKNLKFLGYYL